MPTDLFTRAMGALKRDKEITAFPTYGFQKPDGAWVVPIRVWVSKARGFSPNRIALDQVVDLFQSDMEDLDASDREQLSSRLAHFVADDDSGETVRVGFDGGPTTTLSRTNRNGLVEHDLELSAADAERLLGAQAAGSRWLTYTASVGQFSSQGRVRLVEPTGLSIVSDIDDTIKVSEVPAGKRILLRNVFLRDWVAVEGMAARYRTHGDGVMFHYVSGSPWQLYKVLAEFLIAEQGFPEGAFHMKNLNKNLLSDDSWHDFKKLAAGDAATLEQKVGQITRLFETLPQRQFILIGDSGEKDPEVFRRIRDTFGARVRDVIIRDVVDERSKPAPNRLEGMTVIEAPAVVHGRSQFT